MCKYHFCKGSVKGLTEDILLEAKTYIKAKEAVKKHIDRRNNPILHNDVVVKVMIECNCCGEYYKAYEHIDPVGHKNMSHDELVKCALCKNSKYKRWTKKHSRHSMDYGLWIPDGDRRLF